MWNEKGEETKGEYALKSLVFSLLTRFDTHAGHVCVERVVREIWIRSSEFVETSQKVKCWQGHWKLINGREMVRLKDAGKFLGDRVTHEIRWKSKSTLAYMWNVCWWAPCCLLLVCSFLVGLN